MRRASASARRACRCERKRDLADADDVAGLEEPAPLDFRGLVIQERAIAAVEIFQVVVVAIARDRRVLPAHGADVDHHLAFGVPPHDGLIRPQLVAFAGLRSVIRRQIKHDAMISAAEQESGLRAGRIN